MTTPKTLFDHVWDAHVVQPETPETPAVLYIDLHLIHEVTSPQAFTELRERGERCSLSPCLPSERSERCSLSPQRAQRAMLLVSLSPQRAQRAMLLVSRSSI